MPTTPGAERARAQRIIRAGASGASTDNQPEVTAKGTKAPLPEARGPSGVHSAETCPRPPGVQKKYVEDDRAPAPITFGKIRKEGLRPPSERAMPPTSASSANGFSGI